MSPYLILFGAETMALLFLMNPEITGFKINSKEFKITQFADDTTLILDGSQHSLQAALNTLEIYGNFSGLKMNKEETKVIWIGRKKYSKDKLNVSVNLDWGKVEFVLRGITVNVNLNLMPDINLVNILENANTSLKVWQMRKLTPLGKITVLKSLILSKFPNVFLILPIPEIFFLFISPLKTSIFTYPWVITIHFLFIVSILLTLPLACSIQLVICLLIYHISFTHPPIVTNKFFFFDITIHYLYFFKHYILCTVYNSFCYSTHYSNKGLHLPRFLLNSSNLLFIPVSICCSLKID